MRDGPLALLPALPLVVLVVLGAAGPAYGSGCPHRKRGHEVCASSDQMLEALHSVRKGGLGQEPRDQLRAMKRDFRCLPLCGGAGEGGAAYALASEHARDYETRRIAGENGQGVVGGCHEGSSQEPPVKVLRIVINHVQAGFYAALLFAINQLQYAELHQMVPYVEWGEFIHCTEEESRREDFVKDGCSTGRFPYHAESRGPNAWEYFFERVSGYDPACPYLGGRKVEVVTADHGTLWDLHFNRYPGVMSIRNTYYGNGAPDTRHWDDLTYAESYFWSMRAAAHRLVSKYIRVRGDLQAEADAAWKEMFPRGRGGSGRRPRVVGVHVRLTDFGTRIEARLRVPEHFYPYVDAYLKFYRRGMVFLETDTEWVIGEFEKRYPGKVMYLKGALRSNTSDNAFYRDFGGEGVEEQGYRKGKEALLPMLLFAKCDFLLKPGSGLSETSIYFNLDLHARSVDVMYMYNRPVPGFMAQHSPGWHADSGAQFKHLAPPSAMLLD